MNKIINEILNLKKLKRDNYYFMRRRVNKGNGKKTLGWMLQSENNDMIYENKDFNVEISSPSYVKGDAQFDSSFLLFSEHIIQDMGVKYQYDIIDKDGNKTKWRLYVSPKYLFVASYNNTAKGSEIIWEIAKLSR